MIFNFKKYLIFICVFHVIITIASAQNTFYISTELEAGLLDTSYETTYQVSETNISSINFERNSIGIKGSISGIIELKNKTAFEVGLSQSVRFWNLESGKTNNYLIVKHRLWFTSVFVGAWYSYPVIFNNKLSIYAGSKFSVDFLDNSNLEDTDGSSNNFVVSNTKDSESIGLNVIPEIGVKGHFKNGDQWQFGIKYYLPLNGNYIEGTASRVVINLFDETKYESSGQILAASLRYNFKL